MPSVHIDKAGEMAIMECAGNRPLATMVLVGVQPSFTHEPPTCLRSMRTVFRPASARVLESGVPACPEPTTIAS